MRLMRVLVALVVCGTLAGLAPAPTRAAPFDRGCTPTGTGYRCIYGPIAVTEGRSSTNTEAVVSPPEAGFITSARATLLYEDGTRVPKHAVHLHHAVWVNPLRDDMTCDGWPDRFFATGKERTKLELPTGYGYRWDSGSFWGMNYHLDSHHVTGDVYLKLNVGFHSDAEPGPAPTDVRPVWFDVDNCSDSEFDVRRDTSKGNNLRSWNFVMPEGGKFVALAGHLHDGGIRLRLVNDTTGEPVFTSRAVYEYHWNLLAMTTYSDSAGIPVSAGDELRLTAVYDDDHAWRGVMGIMIGALAPAD